MQSIYKTGMTKSLEAKKQKGKSQRTETCLSEAHSRGTTPMLGPARRWTGSGTWPPHSSTPPCPQERPPAVGSSYLQERGGANICVITHVNHQTIKFHVCGCLTMTKGATVGFIKICQQQGEAEKKRPSGSGGCHQLSWVVNKVNEDTSAAYSDHYLLFRYRLLYYRSTHGQKRTLFTQYSFW